jgi:hypothetical protein
MSNRALRATWGAAPSATAQVVLANLADRADDATLSCYPRIARIAADTKLSERAVQKALTQLEATGLLMRERREQASTLYRIRLAEPTPTGEPRAPLPEPRSPGGCTTVTPPGEPRAPVTLREEPSEEPSRESPPPKASGARTREAKGTRLPEDWEPSGDDRSFAWSVGCDPQAVAARFRDYWRAQPGAKGRKADWPATWRNWCRREAERPASRSPTSRRTTNADHLAALGLAPDGSPLPQFNIESRPA